MRQYRGVLVRARQWSHSRTLHSPFMDRSDALVAIVDDEQSIRRALLRLFRLDGFSAKAFSSAADFLDSLSERTPDCVILDLHMPGMTGVQLLRRIRTLERPPPVIVITAHGEHHTRDECRLLGARDYLLKPIDSKALLQCVQDILDGSSPGRPAD
jgi:FixJ family two-component response regulator